MSNKYGPSIVHDGLVLCLDAADNNSYPGSGTTWYDLSGNGNHGTTVNSPTYSTVGNGSFLFNASSQNINCGRDDSLDLTSGITLIAWVNATSIALNGHVIGKAGYGSGYCLHYDAAYEGQAGGGFQTTNTSNGGQWEWATNISTGLWYQIAYTYDSITERGYYNSNSIGSQTNIGTVRTNSSYDLLVGYSNSDVWKGYISIIQVYNKALSHTEILQNYNAQRSRFGV